MTIPANKERRRKRRAKDIRFGSADVELKAQSGGLPRFEAVAYSGGKLFVSGFSGPVVVDLEGLEINANASILLDHNSQKRVGHPESITVREGKILASGVISADTEHAREVVASSKNGFRWQVSIGARVMSMKQIKAGQRAIVNGQNHEGPFVLAQRSRLNEISFVGSGGDEDNSVSIAAQRGKQEGEVREMAKKADVKEAGSEEVAVDETQATVQASAPVAEATVPSVLEASREEAAKEVERTANIRAACIDYPEIHAQAIREGWDPARAELEVLRKERDKPDNDVQASSGGPFIQSRQPADRNTAGQAIEASLCMQFGMDEEKAGKKFDEQVMDRALSAEYRGLGLHYLMYQTIQASGGHYRPGVMDDQTIRSFLDGERNLQASAPGTFSHLTTTGILSNVANKMLLDSFLSVKTTIPTIFGRRTVTDFKQNSSYRLSMGDELVQVPAGGEIKHAQLAEESYTNQAKTWGRMLTLTRQDIINDDLGAFEQIPRVLGRKSALKLEKEGWRTILGNAGSFFAAGNNNLVTGATSTLSISSLTDAEQLFMDQTDASGDPIMLSARYLVGGTALATVASQLMTESRVIMEQRNTSATSAKAVAANNPHAGKWDPVISPFANSQGLTGSSATKWWLFADPADVPAFVVSYLNGRDTPQIESSELDFNHLGMSWRCVFDFGVDQQDPRGAVQIDGA